MGLLAFGILLAIVAGLLALADARWRSATRGRIRRMEEGGASNPRRTIFNLVELEGLPFPVARYLGLILRDGQPAIRRARFGQGGQFLLRPDPRGWRPFTAKQHVVIHPPGFVWDARIRMVPGVDVRVRDSFVDGMGSMFGAVLAVMPVVAIEGTPEVAAGALVRYLAESVWFPTALLPGQGVKWTELDDTSARASLTVGSTAASLEFHFGPDGLLRRVFTPARARQVGDHFVSTTWQGRFWDYQEHSGMRIPMAGEVEWLLPEGPQPYWRGLITEIDYEFDQAGVS
jgi:hypothetical protein